MPRNVSVYAHEIDKAIQILRAMNKTIITRRAVEEEIEHNRSRYPQAPRAPGSTAQDGNLSVGESPA